MNLARGERTSGRRLETPIVQGLRASALGLMPEWLAEGFRATGMLQRLPEDCSRQPALIDELLDGARAARNSDANADRHDDLDAATGQFATFLLFE